MRRCRLGMAGMLAMLTSSAVVSALVLALPRKAIRGALTEMRSRGLVARGDPSTGAPVEVTAHNAILLLLASALGLDVALKARSWRCVEVAPGWRQAPGYTVPEGLAEISLSGMMLAELLTKRVSGWRVSKIVAEGHGLSFAPAGEGLPGAYRGRTYTEIPALVLTVLAGRYEASAASVQLAELLMARVRNHLRPAPVRVLAEAGQSPAIAGVAAE